MKTLYIECNMGAAGDMLMSALSELVPDPDGFVSRLNSLGLSGVRVKRERSVKCGIEGTHIEVLIHGRPESDGGAPEAHPRDAAHHPHTHEHDGRGHGAGHAHMGPAEISSIIDGLSVSRIARDHANAVFGLLAEAESKAHGKPVSEIHFHEVGTMDAVTDIVGTCMLMELLAPDRVVVSPVHVGSGFVRCAHGVLPVPAPATAEILRDAPIYGGSIEGELCTPTGAALLKHFADGFGPMPKMAVERIGYGMGSKDFEAANCVRVFLGREETAAGGPNGEIMELVCNLDDMTGEAVGYASDILFENGALDVFTIPAGMKKSRPGILLVCLCAAEQADMFAALMLKHTTSFGVRRRSCMRYTLERNTNLVSTKYGEIRVKTGTGFGLYKSKPEYDDVAAAARKHGVGILEVYKSMGMKWRDPKVEVPEKK